MLYALLALVAGAPAPPPAARQEGGNLAQYLSSADYPLHAIRHREEGTATFRIGIGPDGRVSACAITASSGHKSLDQATCRIMRERLRFAPARDSEGRPVADAIEGLKVTWRLPR